MTSTRTFNFNAKQAELLRSGELYKDTTFETNDSSIYPEVKQSGDEILDHHKRDVKVVWKRPRDIMKFYNVEPVFEYDGFNRHDLDQGRLGNCWFIAAAATLATKHRNMFHKVVLPGQGFDDGNYTGMFRFNLYLYGKWKEVVIDDYLPTYHDADFGTEKLIFCKNKENPEEFWPCLLEKAYAKLRGCYFALDGGQMQDGMVDLTGGVTECVAIEDKATVDPGLYDLLDKAHKMNTMMGASIHGDKQALYSKKRQDGLWASHAYSITGLKKIHDHQGSSVDLLRLMNPWGNHHEWNGRWSDSSREIASLSQEARTDMRFREKDDGEFWMSFDDFVRIFDEIQLCHTNPGAIISELKQNGITEWDWKTKTFQGEWMDGSTAGGCGNSPHELQVWSNPRFAVTLHSRDQSGTCTMMVSLMQKGKKLCHRDKTVNTTIGFRIHELQDPKRPLDIDTDILKSSGTFINRREVTRRFDLPVGTYVIIPSTFKPNEEAEFTLRVYTEWEADYSLPDVSGRIPHAAKNRHVTQPTERRSRSRKTDAFNSNKSYMCCA